MSCTCSKCYQSCDKCYCDVYTNDSCLGCPIHLDFSCVFYHLTSPGLSELTNLGLSNGSTLELVVEAIDDKIAGLNVLAFEIPFLRESFVVNTMQQFVEAVDAKLDQIHSAFTAVPEFADNAAALVGGLIVGQIYRTGDFLKVVH